MFKSGTLYILVNPSMPGLVKIGLTAGAVTTRARALSTTGVPTEFISVYEVEFDDVRAAEEHAHEVLAAHRVRNEREFFRVATTFAIDTVVEMRLRGLFGARAVAQDPVQRKAQANQLLLAENQAQSLYEQGLVFERGSGGMRSMYRAVEYYEQAVKAGHPDAHARLGGCILRGVGVEPNPSKALRILEKGAALGSTRCMRELAVARRRMGELSVSQDRWREFFDTTDASKEAFYYAARHLINKPEIYTLSAFFDNHYIEIMKMYDYLFFLEARQRNQILSTDVWENLECVLHGVEYSPPESCAGVYHQLQTHGHKNPSIVIYAVKDAYLRNRLTFDERKKTRPAWHDWMTYEEKTKETHFHPENLPEEINDPLQILAAIDGLLKPTKLWAQRWDGVDMRVKAPKQRRARR